MKLKRQDSSCEVEGLGGREDILSMRRNDLFM